jgi:hypothetical protein
MHGTYCRLNVSVWASDQEVLAALDKKLVKPTNDPERVKARSLIQELILKEHHDARALCRSFNL